MLPKAKTAQDEIDAALERPFHAAEGKKDV